MSVSAVPRVDLTMARAQFAVQDFKILARLEDQIGKMCTRLKRDLDSI
jgi:hypothetical protein